MVKYVPINQKSSASTGVSTILGITSGRAVIQTPIAPTITNYIAPTIMDFDGAIRLGMVSGSAASPDNSKLPIDWMQKQTAYDSGTDMFAHRPASGREVIVHGSGQTGAVNTDGTWISFLGNAVMLGVNQGTAGAPDYDARGNVIGVAGFARSEKPSDGIVTALWGYASTPSQGATEFGAYSTQFTTIGLETNVDIRHPDPGYKTVVSGVGTTVGWYAFNYQTPGGGVKDMTFGFVAAGNPNDGNYSSTDVDNWNGYHTFGLVDKIKNVGILFGQYFKTGSYGIRFPDTYAGSQEPAAAIHLGNSKIQMGEYVGSTFANNDLWHNGGQLYFRYGGVSHRAMKQNGAVITGNTATNWNFTPSGGAQQFNIGYVASAVNYIGMFASATGGTSAIVAQGSDTNRSIELRTAGTGRVWLGPVTATGDVAITGYLEVMDSSGNLVKLAKVA